MKEAPLKPTVLANSKLRLILEQTLNLSLKDHLSQFLLPDISCPPFNKKIARYIKRQNIYTLINSFKDNI